VVLSFVSQCGQCFYCGRAQPNLCEVATVTHATGGMIDGTTRATSRGAPLRQMAATGAFADTLVTPAINAVRIDEALDLTVAALIGCSVLTGVGAATRTAAIAAGDTVAVLGCGGVGLNVVQGARVAGAGLIIAVDTNPAKLALAEQVGATSCVDASRGDAVSAVMGLTGQRGADVAFEVIGLPGTIDQAIAMTRRGGETVLVGIPSLDTVVSIPGFFGLVLAEKTVKGCWYGSSDVRRDVPRVVELYRQGELDLDALVTRTMGIEEVNEALDALRAGEVARTVIRHRA